MKNSLAIKKLITAAAATIILLYFMVNTTNHKIIFIPFLICSISMVGKSAAQIMHREKAAVFFQKFFILGFLLFLVGFLAVVCYISIRDKNHSLLICSIPFWFAGIYILRRRFLYKKEMNSKAHRIDFQIVISAILVVLALLSGIILIILGIKRLDTVLIFAGAFFVFGSLTFVLAALMVMGYLDRFKIDVFGLYVGVLFTAIGIGFTVFIFSKQIYKLWLLIPVLMAVAGIIQVVKCLRNRK